jgi:serine/threonine-protein kinase
MGEVYRADDLKLGQTVALKFLPQEVAEDLKRLEFFRKEVRLARQVSHPNICRVHDIGEVDGQHFLSMEYVDGEDLRSLLRRIGRLPMDKGIQTARQLFAGLAAAHDKGVLHRDLKPANIMIDGQGQVRITDFGLAQLSSADEQEVVGTPAYMAPEQLARGQTSIHSDLYSLGLILYEMFSGEPAHKSSSVAELRELHAESSSARPPSAIVGDMDPAVERLIMRCLEKEPHNRPPSAAVAAASLPGSDPLAAAIAAGETPSPALVAASGEVGTLSPRIAALFLGSIIVGLLLLIALAQEIHPVNWLPLDLSPAVLENEARKVIDNLGYDDVSADSAYGFEVQPRDLQRITKSKTTLWTRHSRGRRELARASQSDGIRFWFRQSPNPMAVQSFLADWRKPSSERIYPSIPPWTVPDMAGVQLDAQGKLRWFRAVPPKNVQRLEETAEPTWSEWFSAEYVGFELDELSNSDVTRTPPDAFDRVKSWQGTWPDDNEPLRVVATAYQGKPVYFEVFRPEESDGQRPAAHTDAGSGRDEYTVLLLLLISVKVGAVLLAWRNLRLGRGDRASELVLAVYTFVVGMAVWFLQASHVGGLRENALFHFGMCRAAGFSLVIWVFYIAV